MENKKKYVCIVCIVMCFFDAGALNLANPATLIPVARMAVGASYDVGGYTISNDSVPCVMNRFQGRLTFAPLSFLNIGVDAGASRMFVAGDTTSADTIGVFKGNFGFSGGIHIIMGTRFFYNDLFRIVGIGQASFFSSSDNTKITYGGNEGTGAVGLQFHIPRFGYITVGPEIYLISGKNKGFDGIQHRYSNINNVRGWMAIDYFPKDKVMSNNKYYISLEISLSPMADFNKEAALQEIRFSIGLGSITKRLYGEESDVEWSP
jgi:hypothetical protein